MKEKSFLIRVVRDKDGNISIDPTGKSAGRGAYICKDAKCFEVAKKGHKIEKAFECSVTPDLYDNLKAQLEKLQNQ